MNLSFGSLRPAARLGLVTCVSAFSILATVSARPVLAATIGSGATVQASSIGNANSAFQGGTLVIDKSGTYAGDFTLTQTATGANANTIDAKGNVGTFSGVISDAATGTSGNLTITDSVGNGQVVFTGTNIYTGPTTINAGATLALTGTGSLSLSSSVLTNGTLDISGTSAGAAVASLSGTGSVLLGVQSLRISAGTTTFSGTISGTGSLTVSGGIQILDGANTYTGGTSIASAGELELGNGDAGGSIMGNIANSGTFAFNRSDAIDFSQTISGSGNVIVNSGTVTFTTPQSYQGTTTVNTGTLALTGNGDISASSSVTVTGAFDISASGGARIKSLAGGGSVFLGDQTLTITAASGIFSGVISGAGGLVVAGGSQFLTGANSYTGGTSVLGGTLQLGNGGTSGSILGGIVNAGTVVFNYSNAQSFGDVISGTGQVKLLSGTLTFTNPQTYTGLTTISAGTLALAPGASISASQNILANGSFDISATNGTAIQSLSGSGTVLLGPQTLTLTNGQGNFAGSIQGSGAVTVTGGVQAFSGVNSYTGVTTISAGTLALTNLNALFTSPVSDNAVLDISGAINPVGPNVVVNVPSLSGTGTVTLGANVLNLTNAADTFSGSMSGTGGLTVSAGTETITGVNLYTGATTIASGTLALSGTGTLSSATLVTDNGTFDISGVTSGATAGSLAGSGTVTLGSRTLTLGTGSSDFSGTITGTGSLIIAGATQTLSGASSYSGGTTITSGTLQLGDGGKSGSIAGNISNAGTLAFNYGATVTMTFTGAISGSGGVTQSGPGTTILTGQNSYTGTTLIKAGTLQLGNGGTSGAIAGDVTVTNGTLAFDRSDAISFGGVISGQGNISQLGSGTLLLAASNSYTGNTTIAGGSILAIGPADAIAASSHVVDNGVLDVSGPSAPKLSSLAGSGTVLIGAQSLTIINASDSFSGAISGSGGLTVTGGTQTLAGTNGYSGPTAVNGGTLAVTGSITSSSGVTVNAGGTLAGNGTLPTVTVGSGGTLAPGTNVPGTLSISGPLSFASGSTLLINTSSASTPQVAVSDSASLAGTLSVASLDGTYPVGQKMTVLTANGGVTGSFATGAVPSSNGAQFSETVSTDANNVFLTVNLVKLSPALPQGTALNQSNAIGGIDAAIAAGSTLPAAFNNLANQTSAHLATSAQQLDGELGADLARADNAMFRPYENAVFDHLAQITGSGRLRPARLQSQPTLWGGVIGGTDVAMGDAAYGSQKFSSSASGLVAGADWPVAPNLTLGGVLSVGSLHFHAADGAGKGKATAFQIGLYGAIHFTPRIYGDFLGSFGQNSITTERVMTVAGSDDLSASLTSRSFAARYETGIDLNWITPYAAISDRLAMMPAYDETALSGTDNFALSYEANNLNALGVELGFRNKADLPARGGWTLHFSDRLAFRHDVMASFAAPASYSQLPASQFTTYGAQPGKDSVLWSLAGGIKNRSGLDMGLEVDSSVSRRSQSYGGMGRISFTW